MEKVKSLLSEQISIKEVKEVNKEFRIKVSLYERGKRMKTSLIGVTGLMQIAGEWKASVLISLALKSTKQTPTYYLHTHTTKIQFYRK